MSSTANDSQQKNRTNVVIALVVLLAMSFGSCGCAPSAATLAVKYACEDDDVVALQRIVSSGAVPERIQIGDYPLEDAWMYPIHAAACYENKRAMTMFLAAGVDTNQLDSDNRTPLMYLSGQSPTNEESLMECIDMLIQSRADVSVTDKYGKTALHDAASYSSARIVAQLIECGAEVDPTDNRGNTPLHSACEISVSSRKECVAVLLKAGADRSRKNEAGETPSDICQANSTCDCQQLLSAASSP